MTDKTEPIPIFKHRLNPQDLYGEVGRVYVRGLSDVIVLEEGTTVLLKVENGEFSGVFGKVDD